MLSSWIAGLPTTMLPATDVVHDRLKSITKAVLSAGDITISSATINGGIITGGVAAPSGPVVGAVMTAPTGSLTSTTPWSSKDVYIPPTTKIGDYVVQYVDWLKVLQETISDAVSDTWDAWYPTWMCAGVVALGGVAAYVPPAPPSPGAPGPWTAGTITPFTLIGGQGTATSPALSMLKKKLVATAKATPVSMWNGQATTLIPAKNGDTIQGVIESFCDAFESTFNTWSQTALVVDSSGVAALGTATIPAGTIIGGSISGLTIT